MRICKCFPRNQVYFWRNIRKFKASKFHTFKSLPTFLLNLNQQPTVLTIFPFFSIKHRLHIPNNIANTKQESGKAAAARGKVTRLNEYSKLIKFCLVYGCKLH